MNATDTYTASLQKDNNRLLGRVLALSAELSNAQSAQKLAENSTRYYEAAGKDLREQNVELRKELDAARRYTFRKGEPLPFVADDE